MANPLLAGAVRSAPVLIAGAAAVPAIAGLATVATICLCSIMVVRHRTKSHVSLRVRKGQGFVFDVMREADPQSAMLTIHPSGTTRDD